MSIAEQYEEAARHWTDFQSHMHRCVDLVVNLNAQHVIELGVRSGTSTSAWLQGLSVTGGRLTTVDLLPAPMLEHEGVDWVHIEGDDVSPWVLEQVAARGPAEIVFVDTSHELEHTEFEIAHYWPLCTKAMVFHDLYLDETGGTRSGPVLRAVDAFALRCDLEFVSYTASYGLGIVTR